MEEEFIVKTHVEGTARATEDMNQIFKAMGCQGFNDGFLGTVAAVVEIEGGRITKQKLNWGADNDPKFNSAQQKTADALLEAATKAAQGGGDPSEIKAKFVVKL